MFVRTSRVTRSALAGIALLIGCDDSDPSSIDDPNVAPKASFSFACTGLDCQFTDRSFDASGSVVSYRWDFGDNSAPMWTRDAAHIYTQAAQFTVTLVVTDDLGAPATASRLVTVSVPNTAPTAQFSFSCTDLTCQFTDQSVDLDGSVATYRWNFGDTHSSIVQNPAHSYGAAGDYPVTLLVTDNLGQSGAVSWTVTVPTPPVPTASFSVACSALVCLFTNTSTGNFAGALWDFGDGSTGSDWNPFHVYQATAPTTFTVTLTVFDWDLGSSVGSQDITVAP